MKTALSLPVRLVLALGLIGFASSCSKPTPGETLLNRLEEKQFLKYAGANTDRVRAEIKDKGFPALFGDSGRIFPADGLTLAKGGVTTLIQRLQPFLEGQGVKLPQLKNDLRQESYTLLIDGAPLPMWTRADLDRELGMQPGITAGLTAARSFALVNKLLEGAKSPERAYALYSGAALSLMFLTDDLLTVMKTDRFAVPKFIPYKLTSDFPFFGQPQE